jgi:hypothetical protein
MLNHRRDHAQPATVSIPTYGLSIDKAVGLHSGLSRSNILRASAGTKPLIYFTWLSFCCQQTTFWWRPFFSLPCCSGTCRFTMIAAPASSAELSVSRYLPSTITWAARPARWPHYHNYSMTSQRPLTADMVSWRWIIVFYVSVCIFRLIPIDCYRLGCDDVVW